MRKFSPLRWLRSLAPHTRRRLSWLSAASRHLRVEYLEARNLLATLHIDDFSQPFLYSTPPNAEIIVANDTSHFVTYDNLPYSNLPDSLHVIEFDGQSVVGTQSTDIDLGRTEHGTMKLVNFHHWFNYTPDPGYTGSDSFNYRLTDSGIGNNSPLTSNLAHVTIMVSPTTTIGSNVPLGSSIIEGSAITIDDLASDGITHYTRAPGPFTYSWYVDANEAGAHETDPGYAPHSNDLVATGTANTVQVVHLDWNNPNPLVTDLNSLGIVDGQTNDAIITLKVVDANGLIATYSKPFSIQDRVPEPTIFSMSPSTSGGCGGSGATVTFDATIAEPNPSDIITSVSIDWNWDLFNGETPTPDATLPFSINPDGTYSIHVDHTYTGVGDEIPYLFIHAHNSLSGNDEDGIGIFLGSTFSGLPFEQIRAAGAAINLTAPDDGLTVDDYTWSVTKNGQPLIAAAPGNADFSFTPTDPGVYVARVVENHNSSFPNSAPFYEDTYVVVGGGGATTGATITGAPPSDPEGTAINLGSIVEGGCGTHTYAWSVTGGPYTGGTTTNGSTFSFTPTDNGNYVVHLNVDGVDAPQASISVSNVAPSALAFNASAATVGSPNVSVDGSFLDPGAADTHTVHVVWDTGATQDIPLAAGVLIFHQDHVYTSTGSKVISVTVSDDDNGQSNAPSAQNLTVQAAMSADGTSLSVLGTSGADQITLSPGSVVVKINGVEIVPHFNVCSNANVIVSAGDGNDAVSIVAGFTTPLSVTVLGQGGTDTVNVVGTSGDDTIAQTSTGFIDDGTVINVGAGVEGATINTGAGNDQLVVTSSPPVPVQIQEVNDMVVDGGGGNDQITFSPGNSAGQIVARLNNVVVSQFSPTGKLIAHGGGGSDDIQVAGSITLAAWLFGGAGADRIKGGAGNDVILGEAGDDLLAGGNGRDLMIGGTGEDRIVGDPDDDILIGGWTDFDGSPTMLASVMATWTSSANFLARCCALSSVLENDGPNATVHDDDNKDTLTGSAGNDWFFANLFLDCGDDADTRDKITDVSLLELLCVQDIDFIEGDVPPG